MLTGKYVFKSNGEIIAEKENMLTSNGINMINKYLAQSISDWAGSIAVGAFYTSTASTDTSLAYEISRSSVTLKTYRTTSGSNQIVLKASLDPLLYGSIYEIGVIPQNLTLSDPRNNFYLTKFDDTYGTSSSSDWLIGTTLSSASIRPAFSASSRFGLYNLPVPVTGSVATRSGFGLDISQFNTGDYLSLLYYVSTAVTGTPSLTFVLTDSSSNTWTSVTSSINTASALTYYTASFALSNTPGTNFNYSLDAITASFTGTATGSVYFDSLKLMSGAALDEMETLVSRSSSSAALVTTRYGQPLEIEYYLTVT